MRQISTNVLPRYLYRKPYLRHRKDYCESCGWRPPTKKALDVDHVDRDHTNNDPSNLMTLCPNCHRLKTLRETGYPGEG